jgi:hypothetical protein
MQDLEKAIRERAYQLWEKDGCPDGQAEGHWLAAQRDVLSASLGCVPTSEPSVEIAKPKTRTAVLSVITGGGKWVEINVYADPLYQHLLLTAEKKFWRCVQSGERPLLFGIETPRPRLETVKVVDMSASNLWAELAATYLRTRAAHQDHETAKTELKKLVPEDAKEAIGHGLRAKRSKAGAISFDPVQLEVADAPVQ